MRPAGCEADLLRLLASMPFLDRLEMVALSGWSRGGVYEAIHKLESDGFSASVLHAIKPVPPARRFHLTVAGLRRLSSDEEISLDELVRLYPLSTQWRRSLMHRLDSLAVIYRVATAISNVAYPVRFRWYRSLPLDASVSLPDGRTIGILRQGITADRTGFSKRLWRLRNGPVLGTLLIIMADEVRLRHARRLLSRFPGPQVNALLALERHVVPGGPGDRIWNPTHVNTVIDLRSALEGAEPGGGLPAEPLPQRADVPEDLSFGGTTSEVQDHLLPVLLKSSEKRALDLISDWPWIAPKDLAGLLGVSRPRVAQLVNPLEGLGLVARPADAGGRLGLTDRGLALLARRDRTSVAVARDRWSVALEDAEGPAGWRNVSGRRSRQLLRNIYHTDAVHGFVSALATQARLLGWEVSQVDPPFRASRYFRHHAHMRAVNPDAFGTLTRDGRIWPFFLEWERRAVRPSTMSERLAPYLRYFSSHRPTDDHGVQPSVLVVFEDDLVQTHFLRLAREEMQASGVQAPLWVSHSRAIEALGPLGRAWRAPGDWDSPQALPPP